MIISIAANCRTLRGSGVEKPVQMSIASTMFLLLPATGKKAEASKNSKKMPIFQVREAVGVYRYNSLSSLLLASGISSSILSISALDSGLFRAGPWGC